MKCHNNDYKTRIVTIPNILSFFRICLIPIIVWLYCTEQRYALAGCTLILSGFTDIVDGFIARRFHMISDFGKVLDPIADKLTQASMLVCLITRFPLMLLPFTLMLAKETFMSVTGLLVIQRTGQVLGADWHGKAATALLYATMILHSFWFDIDSWSSTILILACSAMITVSFVLYGIQNIRALKNTKKKAK